MPNITVTVSDQIYAQARVFAAYRNTTVSTVVRIILRDLPTFIRVLRAMEDEKTKQSPIRAIAEMPVTQMPKKSEPCDSVNAPSQNSTT